MCSPTYGERKREHFPFRGTIEIDMMQVIAILQVDNRIHKLGRHRYLASLILFKFLSTNFEKPSEKVVNSTDDKKVYFPVVKKLAL